jgi:CBS domain containing-hemolysin-like protein
MISFTVNDLMVPLSEFDTVSEGATLMEAFIALKKAQTSFEQRRNGHRAILVVDQNHRFAGKLSKLDVIEALELHGIEIRDALEEGRMHRLGFSEGFVGSKRDGSALWEKALENLSAKATQLRVKAIMYTPEKGEFVKASATMDTAIHQLIIGHHHSLLVTADEDEQRIVGVLRLTDIFEFVCDLMQDCAVA